MPVIHQFDYKPYPIFHNSDGERTEKAKGKTPYLGVELEVEYVNEEDDLTNQTIK